MMTKWDSIQEYIRPVEPKYWGDEAELENEGTANTLVFLPFQIAVSIFILFISYSFVLLVLYFVMSLDYQT